jgi:hypothetical protein
MSVAIRAVMPPTLTEIIMRNSASKDTALAAFIARKTEIDAAIERIRAASASHFFVILDEVNWGDVTVLSEHAARLKEIRDALYLEDEHAC